MSVSRPNRVQAENIIYQIVMDLYDKYKEPSLLIMPVKHVLNYAVQYEQKMLSEAKLDPRIIHADKFLSDAISKNNTTFFHLLPTFQNHASKIDIALSYLPKGKSYAHMLDSKETTPLSYATYAASSAGGEVKQGLETLQKHAESCRIAVAPVPVALMADPAPVIDSIQAKKRGSVAPMSLPPSVPIPSVPSSYGTGAGPVPSRELKSKYTEESEDALHKLFSRYVIYLESKMPKHQDVIRSEEIKSIDSAMAVREKERKREALGKALLTPVNHSDFINFVRGDSQLSRFYDQKKIESIFANSMPKSFIEIFEDFKHLSIFAMENRLTAYKKVVGNEFKAVVDLTPAPTAPTTIPPALTHSIFEPVVYSGSLSLRTLNIMRKQFVNDIVVIEKKELSNFLQSIDNQFADCKETHATSFIEFLSIENDMANLTKVLNRMMKDAPEDFTRALNTAYHRPNLERNIIACGFELAIRAAARTGP